MAIPRKSLFAIGLAFRVNEETVLFAHEIDRAPDNSGVPDTFARILTLEPGVTAFRDVVPQGVEYWYRHRCGGDDFVSSAYSTPVGPVGAETGERPRPDLGSEPIKRDDPFADGDFAATGAIDGNLADAIQKYDGAALFPIARHIERGFAKDGESPTFGAPFDQAPLVFPFLGGQFILNNASMTGADVYLRIQAVNVTTTGFDFVAKNALLATPTSAGDDFPNGNSLTASDDTTEKVIANGAANDDAYTIHYDVDLFCEVDLGAAPTEVTSISITVAIETDLTPDGSWIERSTRTYNNSQTGVGDNTKTWTDEEVTINVALTSSSKVRIKIKSATTKIAPTGGSATLDVHGYNLATDADAHKGITYTTSGGDTVESATPLSGDGILWLAMATA